MESMLGPEFETARSTIVFSPSSSIPSMYTFPHVVQLCAQQLTFDL